MRTALETTNTREKISRRAHRAVQLHAHTVRLHACGAMRLWSMTSICNRLRLETVRMHAKTVRLHACTTGKLGALPSTDGHDHSRTVHMHAHAVRLHGRRPRYGRFPKSHYHDTVTFNHRKSSNHVRAFMT